MNRATALLSLLGAAFVVLGVLLLGPWVSADTVVLGLASLLAALLVFYLAIMVAD